MSVYRRYGSSHFSYDFQFKGQRFSCSTGMETKREALAYEAELRRKLSERERGAGDQTEITLKEALDLYVRKGRPDRNNTSRVKKLLGELEGRKGLDGSMLLSALHSRHVEWLKAQRTEERQAVNTTRTELALLQAAWNHAKGLGYRVDHSVSFKRPKATLKTRSLSLEEETRLLHALQPEARGRESVWKTLQAAPVAVQRGWQDQYDLVVFLLDTGCRHGEAAKVRWLDVDFAGEAIGVHRWKVNKSDTVLMTQRLREVLRRRFLTKSVTDIYVFTGKDKGSHRSYTAEGLRMVMDRCGLNEPHLVERDGRCTIHTLRHTFASKLARSGKYSLDRIRDRLGHSSITMTERYAHLLSNDDAAKAVAILNDLSPPTVGGVVELSEVRRKLTET